MSVVTEILTEATHGDIGQAKMIAERAERGRQLYLTSRQLIAKTDADTYEIPSCTTDGAYTVHYGDSKEDCTCTDYSVHRGEVSCKHLQAVGIMHAARRAPARPAKPPHACTDGVVYIGYMAIDDNGDEVEAFHAVPCKRCQGA
jgi:hypothetical protein